MHEEDGGPKLPLLPIESLTGESMYSIYCSQFQDVFIFGNVT